MSFVSTRDLTHQSQVFGVKTTNDSLNIMKGLRVHIQNDGCQHCKKVLRDIFLVENKSAGSKIIEPAKTIDIGD